MEIYLDPRDRISYASYYIEGLRKVYGKNAIHYDMSRFCGLQRECVPHTFMCYMAFVISDGIRKKKYIIDYGDSSNIVSVAYDWSDVYAKINIALDTILKDYPKMVSIPPGFGIRINSLLYTVGLCISNFVRCKFHPLMGLKMHLYDYYSSYFHPTRIDDYRSQQKEEEKYVFLASTLWTHSNCVESTNPLRLAFMKACKECYDIQFEGGFFTKDEAPDEYQEFIFRSYIKRKEYMNRIKRSMLVFNTPSVFNCHRWKLGEYLAMGKVIISTPISNLLPEKLLHKVHIYQVTTKEEMKEVVEYLLAHPQIRREMSQNCVRYYEKWASPTAIIKRITEFTKEV